MVARCAALSCLALLPLLYSCAGAAPAGASDAAFAGPTPSAERERAANERLARAAGWAADVRRPARPAEGLSLTLALRLAPRASAALRSAFVAVSDPAGEHYGQYLNKEELEVTRTEQPTQCPTQHPTTGAN